MKNLTEKTAFITGGSKGIGYAIAESLLAEGMKVAVTSRSQEAADKAAEELNKTYNGNALGVASDVRNFESQLQAVEKVVAAWGQLDVMIANAGLGHFAPVEQMTIEQWNEVIDTNLTGAFYSVKASFEALKKSSGYLITIASLAGANFFQTASAYNASKFGLVGFTQAAMLDLRLHGIKTTTIMPGSVATYFNNHIPNEKDAWKIQPEDIGQITVDLLKMPARTLPSKVEVRPSFPHLKEK